jgi:hypothetical protein
MEAGAQFAVEQITAIPGLDGSPTGFGDEEVKRI